MEIIKGLVVKAKAGRDKEGFFVVTDVLDKGFVTIADGRRRKIAAPKLKNVKHLQKTNTVLSITTDRKLREDLKVFKTEAN